jgi:alanyl-tRNA synthetase
MELAEAMNTSAIRQKFIDFFKLKQHEHVPSSSLVPHDDPTLLFTNAGMNQFKNLFLGKETRSYSRAVTAQKCVRAGGKHNDLENVGYTARHHTFFEMMGNFSFGDYFKKEAITFAWEFLTSPEWLSLPKDRLWVTIYESDDEAFEIWHKDIGLSIDRIIRIGDNKGSAYASDNFWTMGDTGPCGPCSEVFYDHGPEIEGGLPGSPEEDGDRYVEIWNCVFMQFNRDEKGIMHPLPKPSVDTGMGLERISAVMQHVHSNYQIDLFEKLIQAAARETHTSNLQHHSLKVIADHIRACCFLIADGVLPSNEGRGYVLRRIIRRALRHGYQLGQSSVFFSQLVQDVTLHMGDAYPELLERKQKIEHTILQEELKFGETLEHGLMLLNETLINHPQTIPGKLVFKLYDTFGFPVDLTADIAREHGIDLDLNGFTIEMNKQRDRGRNAHQFKSQQSITYSGSNTVFTGYETCEEEKSQVLALYQNTEASDQLSENDEGWLILNRTPAYAESGGQVGDTGHIFWNEGKNQARIKDTQKIRDGVIAHHIQVLTGSLNVGDFCHIKVDKKRREAISKHHTATHLLHASLKKILGNHVEQKGSLVSEHLTRFDFSHPEALSKDTLDALERCVNESILANIPAHTRLMPLEEAKKIGAVALFGEKYADVVRILDINDASIELCGGTHVTSTGNIGLFKIMSESGVSSGIRRIEACCGLVALDYIQQQHTMLHQLRQELKAQNNNDILLKIHQLKDQGKQQQQNLQDMEFRLVKNLKQSLNQQWQTLHGLMILAEIIDNASPTTLRVLMDQLKNEHPTNSIIILASYQANKASLLVNVSKDLNTIIKAGDIVSEAAPCIGGKGGGRSDFAQAGGPKIDQLPQAISQALKKVHTLC